MSDLDAVLANVPHTERARALVEHHDSIAQAFLAEFENPLIAMAEVLEIYGIPSEPN